MAGAIGNALRRQAAAVAMGLRRPSGRGFCTTATTTVEEAAVAPREDAPPPPPPPPPSSFDNKNVPLTLVCLGRTMQVKLQDQKEFEKLLEKANGFGVMLPDEPGNIRRNLSELDPSKVYVVVDAKAVLKFTKKMAMEEADKSGYPPGFMNFMNRNKYGKYESDDE